MTPRANRLFLLATLLLASSTIAQQPPAPKPPAPKPWLEMDYGPTLSASIESAYPTRNIAQKGIAIRLDAASQTYVLFDEDLCRYALAWTGGFIDYKGVLFDGTHRVWPSAVGQPIFGTSLMPGWAKSGNYDDPRPRLKSTEYAKEDENWRNRPYGPLPRDHAQYKGLYLHGQQVILSYTVAGTPILDSPGLEHAGDTPIITRTLNIARSAADLDLEILHHPSGSAQILAGPRASPKQQGLADGTLALVGDLATSRHAPATTQSSRGDIAVVARGATNAMTFQIADQSHLRLHIPASATPVKLKLLLARVDADGLRPFTAHAESSCAPLDLSTLTRGGPPRYPQSLTTAGVLAPASDKPYVADTLTAPTDNPFKARMRFGAFDFFPDGHSAAISTWDGDVWLVSNIDDKLDHLTWRRIASGLFQPLGLKILPNPQSTTGNPQSVIHVLCRDQLARLHDLNGDGEIDFYECVNNDAYVTEHFHEFAMGLQTDGQGNFYYAKSARHALDAVTPHHGTVLRISADGQRTDVLATGFRAANGIGLSPTGQLAATDQEGYWTPANRINLFTPPPSSLATPLPFFGNIWSYTSPKRTADEGYDPPLCWIPKDVDRSPAEDLWVTSDRWGPLNGQMLHTSYGTGKLFLVLPETVDGISQGGLLPLPDLAFRSGIMRARFNPGDGQLYLCGLVGWATNLAEPGGFYRVRYTGKPVHLPTALHVRPNALSLTFTEALDKSAAEDLANYAIQQWTYRWTKDYGSKHYRPSDPKKVGHDEVEVTSATLSADGKTIMLTLADLKPVMQMKIQLNLKSAGGVPIRHTIHNTVNRIPGD